MHVWKYFARLLLSIWYNNLTHFKMRHFRNTETHAALLYYNMYLNNFTVMTYVPWLLVILKSKTTSILLLYYTKFTPTYLRNKIVIFLYFCINPSIFCVIIITYGIQWDTYRILIGESIVVYLWKYLKICIFWVGIFFTRGRMVLEYFS